VSETPHERREVYYSGRVQGVGFRYTVRSLASRYNVSGFVRNLPDGRVHLVAEGPPGEIESLLAAVQAQMGRYVGDIQQTGGPASGRFHRFEIRF
jgi:acylphosphatase